MKLQEDLEVGRPRDEVVEILASDDMLTDLLPGDTEITARDGDRRTTRTRYNALGREGVATFHWTFLMDGNLRFEKVCDGNVWKRLSGVLEVEEAGEGSRLHLELEGTTKTLVPEFTIKGPMASQLEEMVRALRERLERS